MRERTFWINTMARDRMQEARTGAYMQTESGKAHPLRRMSLGDYVLFFSPQLTKFEPSPCQRFTAVAQLCDDVVYQAEEEDGLPGPFRRNAQFFECIELDIRLVLDELSFIPNKKKWGLRFRSGLFQIPKTDFEIVARHMNVRYR